MQNYEDLIRELTETNQRLNLCLAEANERFNHAINETNALKLRLDVALNSIVGLGEENQQLRDEIAILKGQKPRPKIPPSSLEGPKRKDKNKNRIARGQHPRRKKKTILQIHNKQRIKPASIPEGAIFKGCKTFNVQDIKLSPYNTVYELERWQLPDGTYVAGKLPENLQGHYGPFLVAHILNLHYGCRVTEPLLLIQLREMGVLLSAGQLSNILIQKKDAFHQEKDDFLIPGLIATGQAKVDDTGARHKGQNGYSTVIGSEYFTSITTTESKSRLNFLTILHAATPQYLVNEDTACYMETIKPKSYLVGYLQMHRQDAMMDKEQWKQLLFDINITDETEVKLVTEAALFASLIEKGIPRDLGVHGDDAGQFNVFVRSLCWIHEERHYRKIIPADEEVRLAVEKVREELWDLYKGLKEYKLAPDDIQKAFLDKKFEVVFSQKTTSPTLNNQLEKTHKKKEELLRVLERPQTPLHNNGTETDAREHVCVRKISGGTRSDEGRRCRDTFVSLKKTCYKLKISFFSYLLDRVSGLFEIPPLTEVIKMRIAQSR